MADSATIVAASLDSYQLETSINKLVSMVAEKTKAMADNFTSEVARMEQAVKNLGNIKIDSGGTADGGSSRRTSKQREEESQVKATTQAYKEQSVSLDQLASAQQKAIRLPSEMRMPDVAKSARESFQAFYKGFNEQARQIEPLIQSWEKLLQARHTGNIEQVAQKIAQVKHEIAELVKEQANLSKTKPQGYLDEIAKRNPQIKALREQLTSLETEHQKLKASDAFKDNPYLNTLRERLQGVKSAMNDADTTNRRWLQTTQQLTEAQKKSVDEQMKLFYARTMKIPTDQYDMQIAKLERIQSLLQSYRRGEVSFTPAQLSGLEKEERTLSTIVGAHREIYQTQQQVASSTQQTVQYAHQYTEEIKRQAQAIRESQQYQKGERVVIATKQDGTEIVAFSEKRLSLEEQIINAKKAVVEETAKQKKEEEETVQATRLAGEELKKIYQDQKAVNEEINKRANGVRSGGTTPFQSYDNLRQSIASVLGIQEQQVKMANAEKDSYNQLSSTLKQLRQAYDALGKSDRNSDQGKALIASMHEVERAMQKIKAQAARPVSLESIIGINGKGGLSEKTLDDIAYKMQRLSSLRSGLNVETQQTEIRTVNAEYDRLKKKMDEVMQKNSNMIASNNALGRSWNYMKNRLAFYFTVGASTQFIKNLIEVRSQYEMNEKALGILLDSASRGTRIFNELSQMSLVSPYTLIELSSAAKQLTAYDIAAKDVVDTTRRLADMASAVGVPVERLTYALGQIKAYGYLNSRDARMFANAGIPLVKQLADYYSELEGKMVSTADVYDRMKKKAIDYNDVMKVVTKMTDEGGKFFDFQAKMADTLKVRLANLTLAWNNMLNDLGKSNQGGLTTSIKSLTVVFRHWREIYRVLSTLIVALGAYKVATMLAGITTKGSIGRNAVASWLLLKRNIDAATGATAKFSVVLKSIPFTAWVTTIATLASYFYLFNNSTDGLKQKLEDIATAFDGVRKEITDLYADALKSDSIGSQLTKLRDMLELAQTELGVTIPIKLEEVNEGNVKQKLKEVKDIIDNYLNFSQEFSEAAAGTKFNELMNEFGANARSTYTGISESINTVVVALQDLVDKGNASKRDIEILNELTSGQKEDESRIEYLQRLVRLYEELGLVGKKVTTPSLSFFSSSTDNMNELTEKQNEQLDRLGIKNKQVFENMLKDVQGYYSSSSIAQYQFEQQVERVAKRIDINNIPVEQRTLKLSAAINEEASLNNWNQFEKEFARQIANQKFGTQIEISEESKGVAEQDLKDWQKKQQEWAAKNGITIPINFQTNDTEISYAKRMLQAAKDAKEEVEVQKRKLAVGTGSQDAVDAAKKAYENARILAKNAGADLEQLDKKANAAAKKAAKAAETELSKALKDELSIIEKVRSIYKELTKEGASHTDAVEKSVSGYEKSVANINKVLEKYGVKLDLTKFAGISNPHELQEMFKQQLNALAGKAKPTEIQAIEVELQKVNLDVEKYDLTKITKGLNNELDKLKDEYELSLELDANPELGDMFADMFGIDTNTLPQTFGEALDRAQDIINRKLSDLNIASPFDIMQSDVNEFANSSGLEKESEAIKELAKWQNTFRDMFKKNILDSEKMLDDYVKKYGDYSDKVAEIERNRIKQIRALNNAYYTEQMRKSPEYKAKENAINQGAQRQKDEAKFDEFKNSQLYIRMFENLDYVSTQTLQTMKERLEQLKNSMKNLSPEQLKQIQSQYQKITKELSTRSPFKGLIKNLKDYRKAVGKEGKQAQKDFADKQKEYDAQAKLVAELKEEYEQKKDNKDVGKDIKDNLLEQIAAEDEKLAKLKQELDLADKLNQEYDLMRQTLGDQADAIAKLMQVIAQNLQSLAELRDLLSDQFGLDLGDSLNGVIDGLAQTGQGISKAVSSAQSGDVFGVVSGVVGVFSGIADGVASIFGDGSARTRRLNKEIERSVETVRQLNLAYKELEYQVNRAMGAEEMRAKASQIENKKAQLEELKRQMQLEQSKRSKDRDDDKIKQYQESIKDLEIEIREMVENVTNDLLGGDLKAAAESFVDVWVQAWREGGDTMEALGDKFDDMIDNMIMKSIASRVVSQRLKRIWDEVDKAWADDSEGGSEITMNELSRIRALIGDKSIAEAINDDLTKLYGALGIAYGVDKDTDKNLSALQQGIQGITEDTAGALEAYMNGVSQQVYYQSDLLTQIRDAVVGFDLDVQVATMSQILLQLQSSYTVQMSIQGILEGWNNPSGQAVRVELIS